MSSRKTAEQREAHKAYMRAWHAKNRDRERAYKARPEVLAKRARVARKKRRQDGEAIRAYNRRYHAAHAEKYRAANRKWKAANPDRVRLTAEKFRKKNPTYWRDWQARVRNRRPWVKFISICAANRAAWSEA